MAPQAARQLSPDDVRAAANRLPRTPLAHLPTPLEFLPRFSRAVGGPPVYIKRDDCTGLALGGNKTRHNEFLIGDAIHRGCDLVVWGAGVQSNNCRQTAAACARVGLDCHLVLGRGRRASGPDELQGNLLLDHLVGAHIEIVDEGLGPALEARIAAAAERWRAAGRTPYFWDSPVVKPLAAVSYAICMAELLEQTRHLGIAPAAVYVSSAGSTGAGAALGKILLGVDWAVRNIAPLQWPWDTQADMAGIATSAAERMGLEVVVEPADIDITFDYIPPGYGQCSPGGMEALALLARTEGIVLDPIYSGKALAALIHDIRTGRLDPRQPVILIHTGGTPALFAYADTLGRGIPPTRLTLPGPT